MPDADEAIGVSVVLVTYNSRDLLEACLTPLARQADIEIVVVDNDSSDGTPAELSARWPDVVLVEQGWNSGFAKAVNAGIARAAHEEIVLLNPDAVITADHVRQLAARVRTPDVGIVAPLIADPAGSLRIVPAGHAPTIWRMFAHYSGISRFARRRARLQGHYLLPDQVGSAPRRVDWVTGACLAVQRTTWRSVGGVNERWFMYAEDIDFCHRVHDAGHAVVLQPDLTATHLVGQSDATKSFTGNAAWVVNLHDFYSESLSPSRAHDVVWGAVVAMGLLSRAAVLRVRAARATGTTKADALRSARTFSHYASALAASALSPRRS